MQDFIPTIIVQVSFTFCLGLKTLKNDPVLFSKTRLYSVVLSRLNEVE